MHSSLLASVTQVLWKALENEGHDCRRLFERAGLDADKLYDANARYPYAGVRKIWQLAIAQTNDPCFALVAACCWHPANFHGLGFAWLASTNLKEAVERAIRYFRIVTSDPEQLFLIEHADCYEFIVLCPRLDERANTGQPAPGTAGDRRPDGLAGCFRNTSIMEEAVPKIASKDRPMTRRIKLSCGENSI